MTNNIKKSNVVDRQDLQQFLLLICLLGCSLVLCFVSMYLNGYSFSVLVICLCLIVSIYVADFISGIFHFLVDYTPLKKGVGWDLIFYYEGNKGSSDYLKLRKKVFKKAGKWQRNAYFFKMHHVEKPNHIAKRPAYTTFLPTLPVSISLMFYSLLFTWLLPPEYGFIPLVFCLSGFVVFWAQYIHSVTHGRKTLGFIKLLQKYRILMTIRHHMQHHKYPDQYFCFVNGWADPLVNQIANALFALKLFNKEALAIPQREVA